MRAFVVTSPTVGTGDLTGAEVFNIDRPKGPALRKIRICGDQDRPFVNDGAEVNGFCGHLLAPRWATD